MAARIETPLEREPVEIAPRATSAKTKAHIIARDGHRCRYPGCEETTGLEVDHVIPLAMGGKDEDANLETLCSAHHLQKTKLDVKLIAKCKRLHLTHIGQKPPPTQKLKSRGFQKRWRDA